MDIENTIMFDGGNHTLILGECLEVMAELPDDSIDIVVCDLPYGTTQCKWDSIIPLDKLWSEYNRVAKKDAPFVLFSSQPFTAELISSNKKNYRHIWYWQKEKGTGFFNVAYEPLRIIEEVCIFSRTAKYTFNPQMIPLDKPYRHTMPLKHSDITGDGSITGNGTKEERVYKTYTHKNPTNILKFSRDKANKSLIPSQKPLALVEYFIMSYSHPGDVILDNTVGSGTTMVAAKNLDRRCIGIEKSKKHFDLATQRMLAQS